MIAAEKLQKALVVLAVVLAIAIALLAHLCFASSCQQQLHNGSFNTKTIDFTVIPAPYDIDPGAEYVVYTNFACPYCATFFRNSTNVSYGTRLLYSESSSNRFKNQTTVLPFMLKLYFLDSIKYRALENFLYNNQDEWISLDTVPLLILLNHKAGTAFSEDSLLPAHQLLIELKQEAPSDIGYVPALVSNNTLHEDLTLYLAGA